MIFKLVIIHIHISHIGFDCESVNQIFDVEMTAKTAALVILDKTIAY